MRYIINDNEGGEFGSWSYDNPPTETEIIKYFKSLSDDEDLGGDEPIPLEAFSLSMISDLWNVEIKPYEENLQWITYYLKQPIKACYINLLNKERL